MYRYLTGVAEDLLARPVPIIVDIPLMRRDAHGILTLDFRLIYWYYSSMRSGRLMLHPEYEALRQSRAEADENSHHPKVLLETLVQVKNTELPPVPDLILENPLPPNLVVTETSF